MKYYIHVFEPNKNSMGSITGEKYDKKKIIIGILFKYWPFNTINHYVVSNQISIGHT